VQASWRGLCILPIVYQKFSLGAAWQLTGPLHPINSSPKVRFRCCPTMWRKWLGAPSCMSHVTDEETHVKRVLVNNLSKNGGTLHLLGKTIGSKSWSSMMPTQTLMENRCWCLDDTVVWRLSSTQTWVLWKFTILCLVNPASSVNKMLATKCADSKWFCWWCITLRITGVFDNVHCPVF
jgi:hypothetical protein